MKNKAKLAFEMLEKEIELISSEEMGGFVGGSTYTYGSIVINTNANGLDAISFDGGTTYGNLGNGNPSDCVFQTMAQMSQNLGQGYSADFIEFLYQQKYGDSSDGVAGENLEEFLNYVLNAEAIDVCGLNGDLSSQNIFCSYNTGDNGNQHAVVLQSINQEDLTARVYDPQAGGYRTISIDEIYYSYQLGY